MRRCEELELVFQQEGRVVDDLLSLEKFLRAMPVVDMEMPTLCLIGAPLLVRILSIGKPEICNYPFTTRRILMGHIVLTYQRFQMTYISLGFSGDVMSTEASKYNPIQRDKIENSGVFCVAFSGALDDFKDLNLAQRYEEQDMRNKKKVKEKVVLMISKKKGKEKVILCKICFAMMYVLMIMCVRHIWMINEMIF
ncbi:unnamed protein product [Thlaspi arvense]|uniref:Uncharacterized protein n=1 Tax=Thlaspi arvense TaxID=13288 RepID=A0AAU9RRX8_THLAR|nr:unnamed protein product [Thlaspi arvense]